MINANYCPQGLNLLFMSCGLLKCHKETFGDLSHIFGKFSLFLILAFPETSQYTGKFGNKKKDLSLRSF